MSFGYATATDDTWATGMDDINALLSGTQWESNEVRYSFTSNFKYDYELSYLNSDSYKSSFKSLNEDQREAIYDWVAMYEDVSLLDMVELTGSENDKNATIRIAKSLETAHAFFPDDIRVEAGDIWFNHDDYEEPTLGNHTFVTFGHEIGHALGLEHGHEENGVSNVALNYYRDSMEFSIMTYRSYVGEQIEEYNDEGYPNEDWGYAQSLMMYDIRAIQQMYGANFDTNSGDTIYRFSPSTGEMLVNGMGQGTPGDNRIFRTIWDGDGIDTYNFDNYTTNLAIDLEPGGWSDLDVGGYNQKADLGDGHDARAHVFNALTYYGDSRSLIENAVGGSGDDSITGNVKANTLIGAYGSDTVDGGFGEDLIYGDNTDNYSWGDADDLYGGVDDDIIYGGGGNDSIEGNSGIDLVDGQGGNDIVIGGSSTDTVDGGSGNDTLIGSYPNSSISGSGEYDRLTGGSGADNFVLGDSEKTYYQDFGYAIVTDFDYLEKDKFIASGSYSNYSLEYSDWIGGFALDTIVEYEGDVIAIVEDNTNVLMLDFTFV